MKKFVFLGVFLFFSQFAFSYSFDVSAMMNFNTVIQTYTDSNNNFFRFQKEPRIFVGISNYNFFGKKHRFGFFEVLHFIYDGDFSTENFIGPAFKANLSPKIIVQGGPALHVTFMQKETSIIDKYHHADFSFGLGTDAQIKFKAYKCIYPMAGFSLAFDFLYLLNAKIDGKWYYATHTNFFRFSTTPYIGLSIFL